MLCRAPANAIAADADLYADELSMDAPEEGATLLIGGYSRYVVDLNRDPGDYDSRAVSGGKLVDRPCGLIWRATSRGETVLAEPVSSEELERRLACTYRPYHESLTRVVERKLRRFGAVVVVSVHSMPSNGYTQGGGRVLPRADVVTGTRGRSTASPALIGVVALQAAAFGWTVAHDDPYAGGATTLRLGHPERGVHAIQIELARRLYMDERSLARKPGSFGIARSFCRGLVAKLGAAALG
jgi:N-formylglutamate amidohydrolase